MYYTRTSSTIIARGVSITASQFNIQRSIRNSRYQFLLRSLFPYSKSPFVPVIERYSIPARIRIIFHLSTLKLLPYLYPFPLPGGKREPSKETRDLPSFNAFRRSVSIGWNHVLSLSVGERRLIETEQSDYQFLARSRARSVREGRRETIPSRFAEGVVWDGGGGLAPFILRLSIRIQYMVPALPVGDKGVISAHRGGHNCP